MEIWQPCRHYTEGDLSEIVDRNCFRNGMPVMSPYIEVVLVTMVYCMHSSKSLLLHFFFFCFCTNLFLNWNKKNNINAAERLPVLESLWEGLYEIPCHRSACGVVTKLGRIKAYFNESFEIGSLDLHFSGIYLTTSLDFYMKKYLLTWQDCRTCKGS